mmetsp:Transcript_13755/g.16567  ORF Transcript_13755/g.16567 Transcript_13755/m.16567 type:complete len:115 (+) Transcript_13755:129-473(+)|eukprot:CAMPEP_0197847920 /NCGR_PEP_ID=MMETSP1438-20131217/7510_1 /TAXON_ID=1461541 /ORGANISM="Pterosperma sp., Strain CCMP1384" /LENGTH=114 /DNA_ID=CAMNT_0043460001 /DNA_START=120 /DNA_END=464 /DNA_ORIENTATION=-
MAHLLLNSFRSSPSALQNLLGSAPRSGQAWFAAQRLYSTTEDQVTQKLKEALETTEVVVTDTSGGCGSMYDIKVVSEKFKGLRTPKQHQMVTTILSEEIPQWHGFTLKTSTPAK